METISLAQGMTLYCFHDERFKQSCLSVQLVRPMCAEEAAMNALIPAVLLRGTNRYPDLRSITARLDDLYGAAVSPLVRRIGDYQTTGLYVSMMDDRFALPGDRVMEPMLDFLRQLLLDSPLRDGGFLTEFVESEKKNLISAVESELSDKRAYAMNALMRSMCRADSFGLPRVGEKEQIRAIEPAALYEHYRKILAQSRIQFIYVGAAPSRRIADALQQVFAPLERGYVPLADQSDFHDAPGTDESEQLEIAQGKLCMGFTTPITNRTDDFVAMQLLNIVLGAGMTSKLFQQIREKRSLCYYIGSGYHSSKGLVTVSAGIDFDKETVVKQEVLHQLEECRLGHITQEELTAAREALLSGLRGVNDSPSAVESYHCNRLLSQMKLSTAEHIAAIESVTPEQVAAAARTLQPHSTFFLKGVNA